MRGHIAEKLRQHRRIIAGYWLAALLVAFVVVLVQMAPELGRDIARVAQAQDWTARLDLLTGGAAISIGMTLLVAFLTGLLVGIATAGAIALLILVLPFRLLHLPLLAGPLLHGPLWIVILSGLGLGLGEPVEPLYFLVAAFGLNWALTGLWRYLPVGVTYRGRASRWVPLPPNQVAQRLVPGGLPLSEMADIALAAGQVEELDGGLPEIVRRPDGWVQRIGQRPKPTYERDIYGYRVTSETRDGTAGTRLDVALEVDQLGPGLWYVMWIRNATEDYATHLAARLTGTRDLSWHGRFFGNRHRKAQRKAQRKSGTGLVPQ